MVGVLGNCMVLGAMLSGLYRSGPLVSAQGAPRRWRPLIMIIHLFCVVLHKLVMMLLLRCWGVRGVVTDSSALSPECAILNPLVTVCSESRDCVRILGTAVV
jgi:hypothetical protein